MPLKKAIKRELEVAFAKDAQPVWFRVSKYIVLAAILYFFWGTRTLWVILAILFIFAMFLHFWYRYKTQGWTKSYRMWKHEKEK